MRILQLAVVLLISACALSRPLPLTFPGQDARAVYIVDLGKHAGIAVRLKDVPESWIPERVDFPGADYLEVGWGDWDYYQIEDPGLWVTLKAALWPTPSVLHVVGVRGSLEESFLGADILRLALNREAFERLMRYIHDTFERRGKARATPLRRGYYHLSWFYPARGRFHIFYTCNGWIAEALETAGLPMGWPRPITADQLMRRIRRRLSVQK